MFEIEKPSNKEILLNTAFLVGIKDNTIEKTKVEEHLSELEELVDTMGFSTLGSEIVNLKLPNSKFYIGDGKAEEISSKAAELKVECIIADFDLSPSQQRNWEKLCGICVIDRREVILDIFASRATTHEAVLQVELAKMEYSLPRLKRAWTHLSRQRGGNAGTRGEGETQLEVDKRLVKKRISQLKKEITEMSKHRDIQRASREKQSIPLGAIVGYTNAGKSSLLNKLAGANVFVEDKLFATLDPTTRVVNLPQNQKILLSDTVGFIRKLPHALVEAFKSTLEEAMIADFLVHVLDMSNPAIEEHWATTLALLTELKAINKPAIVVFNKIDKNNDLLLKTRLKAMHNNAVFISAVKGDGIEELLLKLSDMANIGTEFMQLKLPASAHETSAWIYRVGKVIKLSYEDDAILVTARIPKKYKSKVEEFAC